MGKRTEKETKIDRVTLNQIRQGNLKNFDHWSLHLGLYEKQLSIFYGIFENNNIDLFDICLHNNTTV